MSNLQEKVDVVRKNGKYTKLTAQQEENGQKMTQAYNKVAAGFITRRDVVANVGNPNLLPNAWSSDKSDPSPINQYAQQRVRPETLPTILHYPRQVQRLVPSHNGDRTPRLTIGHSINNDVLVNLEDETANTDTLERTRRAERLFNPVHPIFPTNYNYPRYYIDHPRQGVEYMWNSVKNQIQKFRPNNHVCGQSQFGIQIPFQAVQQYYALNGTLMQFDNEFEIQNDVNTQGNSNFSSLDDELPDICAICAELEPQSNSNSANTVPPRRHYFDFSSLDDELSDIVPSQRHYFDFSSLDDELPDIVPSQPQYFNFSSLDD